MMFFQHCGQEDVIAALSVETQAEVPLLFSLHKTKCDPTYAASCKKACLVQVGCVKDPGPSAWGFLGSTMKSMVMLSFPLFLFPGKGSHIAQLARDLISSQQ